MKPQQHSQLILLAHGSRDNNWCKTFEDGQVIINSHLPQNASLAYMEMATPGLESIVSRYYRRGTRDFAVLPLFFAEGRHLLHDIPARISALQQRFAGTRIELLDAVGRQDVFWDFLGRMIASQYTMTLPMDNASESARQ